jgi:hypothetical protein
MKKIYHVSDTLNGYYQYCLKNELKAVINIFQGRLRVSYMDENKLNPASAMQRLSEMDDFVSDNLEITQYDNEEEIIAALN